MLLRIYNKFISDFSKITLFLISLTIIVSFYYSKNFNLDASSDALLLEGDKDLKYLREINERYGSKDFLFLTYSPIKSFTDEPTSCFLIKLPLIVPNSVFSRLSSPVILASIKIPLFKKLTTSIEFG